jgi:hypothetical protein
VKFTKTNLQKLETLFEELRYSVRYEKGNFNSGYCIVEDKNIAVVSKFFDTEGRINVLLDILSSLEVKEETLSDVSLKLWKGILKNRIEDEDQIEETDKK